MHAAYKIYRLVYTFSIKEEGEKEEDHTRNWPGVRKRWLNSVSTFRSATDYRVPRPLFPFLSLSFLLTCLPSRFREVDQTGSRTVSLARSSQGFMLFRQILVQSFPIPSNMILISLELTALNMSCITVDIGILIKGALDRRRNTRLDKRDGSINRGADLLVKRFKWCGKGSSGEWREPLSRRY